MLAALTDDEKALFCILTDPAGIDLAEFAWVDDNAEDKCWRARSYQWMWWRSSDERQIDQSGRDLGKSLGAAMRTCSFVFRWPGGQRAIFAPQQNHLDLLTKVIEDQIYATWLTRQMLRGGRQAIIHSPRFEIVFLNRTQIVGCIPGVGGKGFKGVHAEELEIDEGQDLDESAWKEAFNTVKRHVKGWKFLVHGVTKGVQDTFYRLTLPRSGWTVHRRVGMHRETWTDQERQQFEEEFGAESPDYKRNILGLHGDASSPLFPLAQLMSCADDNELSDYNTKEYLRLNITGEDVGPEEGDVLQFLDFPASHTAPGTRYLRFWLGMDVGRTIAPSEILILGEYRKNQKTDDTCLRLLLRVHMTRVLEPDQADVVRWLIEQYRPAAFAMDSGGVGHPIYQELKTRQERATIAAEQGGNTEEAASLRRVLDSIKGYDFGSKVPVGIMDPATDDLDLVKPDDEPNYVFRNVKEASTDMLRVLVSENRLDLPWDKELISQFQMATFSNNKTGVDEYGRTRRFCVDGSTEALARDKGWVTHDRLTDGDLIWTLNPRTGFAEWAPIKALYVDEEYHGPMLRMETTKFSSLTTPEHRWWVKSVAGWHWEVSQGLGRADVIPRSALPAADALPEQAAFSDDFVDLVAWFWTEGNYRWLGGDRERAIPCAIEFAQSSAVNPAPCDRIRGMMSRLIGPRRNRGEGGEGWSENAHNGMVTWRVRGVIADQVIASCPAPSKAVSPSFLSQLTQDQLHRFIETSIDADGNRSHGGLVIRQSNLDRIRSFEMACALAGRPTNTRRYFNPREDNCLRVLARSYQPLGQEVRREWIDWAGAIWCPMTVNGTFLARRGGSVYFTGNSEGNDHALDAARMAAMAYSNFKLEQLIKDLERAKLQRPQEVFISLVGGGW